MQPEGTYDYRCAPFSMLPVSGDLASSDDPGGDLTPNLNCGRGEGSRTHFRQLHHLRHMHAACPSVLQRDLYGGGLHCAHFTPHDIPEAVAPRAGPVFEGADVFFWRTEHPRHQGEALQLLAPGFYDLDGQTHSRLQLVRLGRENLVEVAARLDDGQLCRVAQ